MYLKCSLQTYVVATKYQLAFKGKLVALLAPLSFSNIHSLFIGRIRNVHFVTQQIIICFYLSFFGLK